MAVVLILEDSPEVASVYHALRCSLRLPPVTDATIPEMVSSIWSELAKLHGCAMPTVGIVSGPELRGVLALLSQPQPALQA